MESSDLEVTKHESSQNSYYVKSKIDFRELLSYIIGLITINNFVCKSGQSL